MIEIGLMVVEKIVVKSRQCISVCRYKFPYVKGMNKPISHKGAFDKVGLNWPGGSGE